MKISRARIIPISQLINPDRTNILVIITIWFLMLVIVNPLGDFPLNDDWVYGLVVKSALETGNFRPIPYSNANFFSQAFWGILFCLPYGFSFTALRFSTLTLGLIGVLVTYRLLREVSINLKISLLGALLIAVNPIYFTLSNTFMTDVPFFTLTVLSFFFLIRGLKKDSTIEIITGIILSYIAILIRQVGLVILIAFGIVFLFKRGLNIKNLFKGFTPALLGVSIQIFYQKWLYITEEISGLQNPFYSDFLKNLSGGLSMIYHPRKNILIALLYIGLFLFPFIIIFSFNILRYSQQKKLISSALAVFFIAVFSIFIWKYGNMPVLDNIINDFGVGPLTLRDTFILDTNYPSIPLALKVFWAVMTGISIVGAVLLLGYLFLAVLQVFNQKAVSDPVNGKWLILLIISAIFIYLFIIQTISIIFDRYFLPLFPLFMLIASFSVIKFYQIKISNRINFFAFMMVLIYGIFTIGASHDYLLWNRSRWQALNDLMQEDHILPSHIDGGYEFNGWYLYDSNYKEKPGKSYWWVDNDEYIISSGPLAGYKEIKQYSFRRWLLFRQENIFVLQRIFRENSP